MGVADSIYSNTGVITKYRTKRAKGSISRPLFGVFLVLSHSKYEPLQPTILHQ